MLYSIKASKRDKKDPMELREDGIIPAVVYGPEIKTISIGVNYKEFEKLHNEAGESSLIDCIVEGEKDPITVLIQDLQIEPLKGRIIHVDFRQIKMGEEMNATVELEFVGESVAVKEQGGTLIQNYEEVNVKCLPSNLVSHINVDLSKLATFDEVIKIKDLVLPEGITVLDDPEGLVAKVAQPLTDEQFKAMETEGDKGVESVEVEGEKKEEGEEGAGVEGEKKDEKVENEKKEDKKEEKK